MQVVGDQELIDEVKDNACSESLKELTLRHSGICYKIFSKFASSVEKKGKDFRDLTNNKDYFIYKAALSFKTGKNVRFSTWLGNYIRYKCLDFLNETGYCLNFESKESQVYLNSDSASRFEEKASLLDKREFVFDALSQLKDKRIVSVYRLRYFTYYPKMSWKKIGEHIGVSTQTAINLHEKGKKAVRGKSYK